MVTRKPRRPAAMSAGRIVSLAGLVGLAAALSAAGDPPAAEPADREMFAMAVSLVREGDADLQAVALEQIRDGLPGPGFSRELAGDVLPALPAGSQPLLLAALGGRGDPAALPGIVVLAGTTSDAAVKAAAIAAIGQLGGDAELPLLLAALGDPATRDAARRALVVIQGPGVADAVRRAVADAAVPVGQRAALAAVIADRRDRDAIAALASLACSEIPQLRAAARQALARLAEPADLPELVAAVSVAAPGREREDAERMVVAVCGAGADRDEAARWLARRYRDAAPAEQALLLPLLGRLGGPSSLAIIDRLLDDPDPVRQRAGLEALARWPDASVVARLLERLEATSDAEGRRLLVGALIRIAPLPNNGLDDAARLALVERTLPLCQSDAERCRLLERAAAIRTIETLRFLMPRLDDPALAESAARGVVDLAHHRGLRDAHAAEFTAALDRVVAVAEDPLTRERAERYRQGKTWKRPERPEPAAALPRRPASW